MLSLMLEVLQQIIIIIFTDAHSWLLSNEVNILPYLLLPLAGPEELKDEEYDELPPDLQYLGSEKQREPDPDIRKMVLEALLQVCAHLSL